MISILNLDQIKKLILKHVGVVTESGEVPTNVLKQSGVAFVYVDHQWQIAVNSEGDVPEGLTFSSEDEESEGDEGTSNSAEPKESQEPKAPKRKRTRRSKEQIAKDEAAKAAEEKQPAPEPEPAQADEPAADPVDDEPPFKVDEPKDEPTPEAEKPAEVDNSNPFAQAAQEVVEEPKVDENLGDVFGNASVKPTEIEGQQKTTEPASTTADQDNPFSNFK